MFSHMRKFSFLAALFLPLLSYAMGDESIVVNTVHYTVQSGLLTNEVNSIVQDDNGFMWFATNNGLSRFDGYEFKNFRSGYMNMDFFRSNIVTNLAEKGEEIWFVTPEGLEIFNQKTCASEYVDNELLADAVLKTILFIDDNKVLLGGMTGLFVFDRKSGSVEKLDVVSADSNVKLSNVRNLYRDRYGNVWIGTWKTGLYFILNDTMEVHELRHPEFPDDMVVTSFAETSGGELVFGTWEDGIIGIRNFSHGRMEVFRSVFNKNNAKSLEWNIIYDLEVDEDGNIWIGSPGGLRVMEFDRDGFHDKDIAYGKRSEITSFNEVKSVFCDRNGIVWVSDFGNGVVSINMLNKSVTELDFRDKGLKFSAVTAIYEDPEEILWLGIRGHGLVRYSPKDGTVIKPDRLLETIDDESNSVVSFVEVPEKNLLFMAMRYFGVYMLEFDKDRNISSIRHFDVSRDNVRNPFTNAAARDSKGNVWVATLHGVVLLADNGEGYELYEPESINRSIDYCNVASVCPGADGDMWICAQEYGVARIVNGQELTRSPECFLYNVKNGKLNNNDIHCLYYDSLGKLWTGSKGGGLSFYDVEKDMFVLVDDMPLFQSDEILSIVEDRYSNLWLATGSGFICYNNVSRIVRNYGHGSGLENISFIKNSVWTDGERIMFGGYKGLSIFRPVEMMTDVLVASPKITDIQFYNNSISNLDKYSKQKAVTMMPPFTDEIMLSHRDKIISITFASPCYGNTSLVKYSYRLKKLEKDWHYVTSSGRTVTYSNLKPGEYEFCVRAVNLSGQWTEPCVLKIKVCPAPWLTTWAILGYILVSIVLIYFLFRTTRNRIMLKQALEIEQMERLKQDEVNNAKLMFFTNVSHELFTPMTIMKVSLEKLMETDVANSRLHGLIRSNLNRLMRLLQQIMEFRKAESSNLKLKVSETDIVAFVRKMCDENFAPYVSDRNISLVFSSDTDRLDGYVDKDKLDKILYNLLSNAYKYNRKDGSVFVTIRSDENTDGRTVKISVKDTGYGIEPGRQADLFKRFYEGDYRRFDTTGVGIGLSLTKELVCLHNGTINVESIVGEGTEFIVTLPIDRDKYREDQIDIGVSEQLEQEKPVVAEDTVEPVVRTGPMPALLLVEDNKELLFVMKDMFSVDYKVFTAVNGADALEILKSEEVNLVITDLVMPVMDGTELCRRIRSDLSLSHLPVIMLSARLSAESKMESFGVGVDAYVDKPFDPKLLKAQVENLILLRKRISEKFRSGQTVDTELLISTDMDKQFIDKVIRLIEEHISESEFNMAYLNSAMNMSNSTLYRKIKGLTGMSPKEFVRNIRFKYACKLLLEKSTNITDVAYMCGFTDAKYFSMIFKREFGMTPSKYISQNRKDKYVDLTE